MNQQLSKPVSEQSSEEYWNNRYSAAAKELGRYVAEKPSIRYKYPPDDGIREIFSKYGLSDEEMKILAQRLGENKRIKGQKFPLSDSFYSALASIFGDQGRREDENIKNSKQVR